MHVPKGLYQEEVNKSLFGGTVGDINAILAELRGSHAKKMFISITPRVQHMIDDLLNQLESESL